MITILFSIITYLLWPSSCSRQCNTLSPSIPIHHWNINSCVASIPVSLLNYVSMYMTALLSTFILPCDGSHRILMALLQDYVHSVQQVLVCVRLLLMILVIAQRTVVHWLSFPSKGCCVHSEYSGIAPMETFLQCFC